MRIRRREREEPEALTCGSGGRSEGRTPDDSGAIGDGRREQRIYKHVREWAEDEVELDGRRRRAARDRERAARRWKGRDG